MKVRLLFFGVICFLFVSCAFGFATDSGALTKAAVKVYSLKYVNDHDITHTAISGDGNWVGIVYSWKDSSNTAKSRVTITDTQGTVGEQTLLELSGNYAAPKYIALNNDGSKVVIVSGNSVYDGSLGWYLVDVATKKSTFYKLSGGNYPEANFELNTLTDCGHRFDMSDKIGFLASYNLNSGELLHYVEGDNNGLECSAPYRMPDGSFLFVAGYAGIKYLSSTETSLQNAVSISNKYDIKGMDAGKYMLVETDCDNVYYYHPITSDKRLIFTDDSNFAPNGTGCATSWVEMGIDSQYTFVGDSNGYHIVQIYGDSFPQSGRYFTGEDVLGEDTNSMIYLFEAGVNNTNRDKHVSSDGKRILVQAGLSYYDHTNYKLYVVEVAENSASENSNGDNNDSGDSYGCGASIYEHLGNYYLDIPALKYVEDGIITYYFALYFQYVPSYDYILFGLYDYSYLSLEQVNTNCILPQIDDNLHIYLPDVEFSSSDATIEFSAEMSIADLNNLLFQMYNINYK